MMLGVASLPPLAVCTVFMFLGMGMLGMGNGSVFQIVPQRFPKEIGVITGIVGAAGGLGGFFLPNLLGSIKQYSGTFSYAFLIFALAALGCAGALVYVSRGWEALFLAKGGRAKNAPAEVPALVGAEVEATA
jgi:NNP family nitrate/nitrite transporter-like MFS transporter